MNHRRPLLATLAVFAGAALSGSILAANTQSSSRIISHWGPAHQDQQPIDAHRYDDHILARLGNTKPVKPTKVVAQHHAKHHAVQSQHLIAQWGANPELQHRLDKPQAATVHFAKKATKPQHKKHLVVTREWGDPNQAHIMRFAPNKTTHVAVHKIAKPTKTATSVIAHWGRDDKKLAALDHPAPAVKAKQIHIAKKSSTPHQPIAHKKLAHVQASANPKQRFTVMSVPLKPIDKAPAKRAAPIKAVRVVQHPQPVKHITAQARDRQLPAQVAQAQHRAQPQRIAMQRQQQPQVKQASARVARSQRTVQPQRFVMRQTRPVQQQRTKPAQQHVTRKVQHLDTEDEILALWRDEPTKSAQHLDTREVLPVTPVRVAHAQPASQHHIAQSKPIQRSAQQKPASRQFVRKGTPTRIAQTQHKQLPRQQFARHKQSQIAHQKAPLRVAHTQPVHQRHIAQSKPIQRPAQQKPASRQLVRKGTPTRVAQTQRKRLSRQQFARHKQSQIAHKNTPVRVTHAQPIPQHHIAQSKPIQRPAQQKPASRQLVRKGTPTRVAHTQRKQLPRQQFARHKQPQVARKNTPVRVAHAQPKRQHYVATELHLPPSNFSRQALVYKGTGHAKAPVMQFNRRRLAQLNRDHMTIVDRRLARRRTFSQQIEQRQTKTTKMAVIDKVTAEHARYNPMRKREAKIVSARLDKEMRLAGKRCFTEPLDAKHNRMVKRQAAKGKKHLQVAQHKPQRRFIGGVLMPAKHSVAMKHSKGPAKHAPTALTKKQSKLNPHQLDTSKLAQHKGNRFAQRHIKLAANTHAAAHPPLPAYRLPKHLVKKYGKKPVKVATRRQPKQHRMFVMKTQAPKQKRLFVMRDNKQATTKLAKANNKVVKKSTAQPNKAVKLAQASTSPQAAATVKRGKQNWALFSKELQPHAVAKAVSNNSAKVAGTKLAAAHVSKHGTTKTKAVAGTGKNSVAANIAKARLAQAKPLPDMKVARARVESNLARPPVIKLSSKTIPRLSLFTGVIASSDIVVHLQNSRTQKVSVHYQLEQGRQQVTADVRNGILYLHDVTDRKPHQIGVNPLHVTVASNRIKFIELRDKSSAVSKNYTSVPMMLINKSVGVVDLHGMLSMRSIDQCSTGTINIDWVQGPHVKVTSSGSGVVKLAGSVDVLDLTALGNAHVDAKYLRSQNVMVKTTGVSDAAVTPINSLNAFAHDRSNIYYYKRPKHMEPRTFAHGNVLQMDYWT